MRSERIRVFQTLDHPCGYFKDRSARNLVIDPLAPDMPRLYGLALRSGFRRSGGHVYRPACAGCRACVPARLPVAAFRPSRSQQRCLARNADLRMQWAEPLRTAENYALYRRYLGNRHAGGGMDDGDEADFERFLRCEWSPTRFLEFRLESRLIAVAVTDVTPQALSSVYTFFDPEARSRGLGTFAILQQIEQCRRMSRPYLYLGYWIENHPKMDYKRRFRPLELLTRDGWQEAG